MPCINHPRANATHRVLSSGPDPIWAIEVVCTRCAMFFRKKPHYAVREL